MIALLFTLSAARADAPELPVCSVLAPVFKVGDKTFPAGTAFPLKLGDKTLVVTAHHLLGPAGGMPAQVTGPEVPAKVQQVVVRDAFTGVECGRSELGLAIADASPMSQEGGTKDVAAFEVKVASGIDRLARTSTPPLATRALAAAGPKVGDTVWVAAHFQGHDDKHFPAKVVEASDTGLYYQYEDASLDLTATSGAAVIDKDGAVVGLNLGGGKMDDGALIGSANPLASIRTRLEKAASGG